MKWLPSPIETVSCTVFALCDRTGGRQGHQMAVVAYRDGLLYCICTMSYDGREARTSDGCRRLWGRSAVLHLYYVIGRAGGKDIRWLSPPIGAVSCTASVP